MEYKDTLKITCKHGFVYTVTVQHWPALGCSHAMYNDKVIASREYSHCRPPHSDNDAEWEAWEERFAYWKDAACVDLVPNCKEYFDKSYK